MLKPDRDNEQCAGGTATSMSSVPDSSWVAQGKRDTLTTLLLPVLLALQLESMKIISIHDARPVAMSSAYDFCTPSPAPVV